MVDEKEVFREQFSAQLNGVPATFEETARPGSQFTFFSTQGIGKRLDYVVLPLGVAPESEAVVTSTISSTTTAWLGWA